MDARQLRLLTSLCAIISISCQKERDGSLRDPDEDSEDSCFVSHTILLNSHPDNRYIAVLKNEDPLLQRAEIQNSFEQMLKDHFIDRSAALIPIEGILPAGLITLTESEARELVNDSRIAFLEPDRLIKLNTCFTLADPRQLTWNIRQVGYGSGKGKTAWVLDTGIDFDHPDLKVDRSRSRTYIRGKETADDENGHGTHVAGIIAARNNTIGVLGVASEANLVALQVLDGEGNGSLSAIIQALAYVSRNGNKGDVVNLSLGLDGISNTLDSYVMSLASKGFLIAIAAGNDSKHAAEVSPARVNAPGVYTVSAVDSSGYFARFSNYGNDVVDYAAPGVRIVSSFPGGRYARMSGTSMAAPHVAGLLLLRGALIRFDGYAKNDPDGAGDKLARN